MATWWWDMLVGAPFPILKPNIKIWNKQETVEAQVSQKACTADAGKYLFSFKPFYLRMGQCWGDFWTTWWICYHLTLPRMPLGHNVGLWQLQPYSLVAAFSESFGVKYNCTAASSPHSFYSAAAGGGSKLARDGSQRWGPKLAQVISEALHTLAWCSG